ncbi:hypothetical protein BBK36DRAFT_1197461 [Trichoderma citrinoviride]|uniref:Uncharacterized protein n=1 Tax=Trichoderma citrinoviride TaxID=58853 RepID=A0A2T4BE93_9HYPO|nr:hypothetical protein BBK36DRAFT_1197461 [Trichoderma citrinoviride]PTB67653.1 hypothetical protein BBK36DRAFT_1197461 [Trichoderma citrinoviride]
MNAPPLIPNPFPSPSTRSSRGIRRIGGTHSPVQHHAPRPVSGTVSFLTAAPMFVLKRTSPLGGQRSRAIEQEIRWWSGTRTMACPLSKSKGAPVRRGHGQPQRSQPRRLTWQGPVVNYQLMGPLQIAMDAGDGLARPLADGFCRPSGRERRDISEEVRRRMAAGSQSGEVPGFVVIVAAAGKHVPLGLGRQHAGLVRGLKIRSCDNCVLDGYAMRCDALRCNADDEKQASATIPAQK